MTGDITVSEAVLVYAFMHVINGGRGLDRIMVLENIIKNKGLLSKHARDIICSKITMVEYENEGNMHDFEDWRSLRRQLMEVK